MDTLIPNVAPMIALDIYIFRRWFQVLIAYDFEIDFFIWRYGKNGDIHS